MKQFLLILRREYTVRLRKPSFIVLTLLVPLLLVALYALPVWASHHGDNPAKVLVVDQTGLFEGSLVGTDQVHFQAMPDLQYAERQAKEEKADAILFIPLRQTTIPHDAFLYYRRTPPSLEVQSQISNQLQTLLRNAILEDVYQLEPSVYHTVTSTRIALHTQDQASGHESFSHVKTVVALVLAILITLVLIIFCSQAMLSIQEERSNRTAEVLATTVTPRLLLLGKLSAVALAGLTQLTAWILIASLGIKVVQATDPTLFAEARTQQEQRSLATKGEEATIQYNSPVKLVDETVQGLTAIQLPLVAGMFLLYFLAGYLLTATLLAALAARLESDADTLQWTLLMLSPSFIVLILSSTVIANPNSTLATTLTLLPFTAPTAAMLRLPFGLPIWQAVAGLAATLVLLAAAAWLAARTYRRHLLA